jgi:hypothetical protein
VRRLLLRGRAHKILREFGLLSINRVTAAEAGAKKPRRKDGRRQEKSIHVEDKMIHRPNGSSTRVRLYARGGALGIGELTDSGDLTFVPLRRLRTHRNRDKNGLHRWYNNYRLPLSYGGGTVTVRLHANHEDVARGFNRTENLRPIPPADDDFRALYARRNDAESINRALVDSLYLGRAHAVGHARQHVNLLGYALMVTSLAVLEHRRRNRPPFPSAA